MEHIVDLEYYIDVYKGQDMEEDEFNKIRNTAEDVILTLVNPSFIDKYKNDIQYAICLEIEYLHDYNYEQISIGKDTVNFESESYPRLLIFKR